MKQFYLVLFFLFISFSYGQEAHNFGGEIEDFKLYPNPVTNGVVYIQTALNAPKRILIFDVFGTQRLETTILRKELNVSNLVAGVYVLRVYEKDKVATRKLIVK
ncbi:T9SS type A sorting domain-containing protein [Eudoraea sp.]|uniref:T9SS type A sorting domain-containing protein n=1 Tax=Eudoraea sp. TaxID=1979955 RepID=UPI003C76FAE0